MSDTLAIGVDLGATKIATALISREGKVIASRETLTEARCGRDAVLDRMAGEIRLLLRDAPAAVLGIGIGSPGQVNAQTGVVYHAVNLAWDEVALASAIAERVPGLPVFVENDANAAAVGEGYFGSARGSRDYVLLTVGSGLGSGIISGGRLISGAHQMAADLGHWPLDLLTGRRCHCGLRGCAETVVSGPGLVAVTRQLLGEGRRGSKLPADDQLNAGAILRAAREGDVLAAEALAMLACWLGRIAALATAVLDPDLIVVGGGLGLAAMDLLRPDMERELLRHLNPVQIPPAVCASTLRSSAMGSASLVWSRLNA